jgi:hypothetical protein
MEDTNKAEEHTVGEEIVGEITEAKNDKNRTMMKHHLKWQLRRVSELQEQKEEIDNALMDAHKELSKTKAMSLDEFGVFIKKENLDISSEMRGPYPLPIVRSMVRSPFDILDNGNIENSKMLLKKKLKLTFETRP